MGTPLKTIIHEIGGGMKNNRKFKAVQMGGPSGGCIPVSLIDTPVDYENINKTGAIMGSGGMVVMDETTCMPAMAKFFLEFTEDESCGKCVPCRIGNKTPPDHPAAHHERRRTGRRHPAPARPFAADQGYVALRPRTDLAQPGADDDQVFPRGVRGSHQGPCLSGPGLHAAGEVRGRQGQVQEVRPMLPGLPGRRAQVGKGPGGVSSIRKSAPSASPASRRAGSGRSIKSFRFKRGKNGLNEFKPDFKSCPIEISA